MKLFLKGTKCDRCAARSSAVRTRRASTAAVASATASTCSSCVRSRSAAASTACSKSSSKLIYAKANKQPGITGENLLRLLELRLDNVVFRTAFASSRSQARQFVRHGHVSVERQARHDPVVRVAQGRRRLARATSRRR